MTNNKVFSVKQRNGLYIFVETIHTPQGDENLVEPVPELLVSWETIHTPQGDENSHTEDKPTFSIMETIHTPQGDENLIALI